MRTITLLAAAAAVALTLAGCSSATSAAPTATTAAACTPTASGANSDAVTVTGDLDALPTTTFTAPMTTTDTERTVAVAGTGAEAAEGKLATIDFTLYNGTSGKQLFTTTDAEIGPQQVTVDQTQFLPGIIKAVQCATVGSRIVAVVPPADAWSTAGNSTLGVAATDTVVFVVDVKDVTDAPPATTAPTPSVDPNMPTRATGADQPAPAGFPVVTLADDGTPTVTIPTTPAPTTLQQATLKKGDGAVVGDGDTVTVQYQGVNWTTGAVFDQSWGKGGPTSFATNQVIKGFGAALVGATVGSQVIVVIPPDQGYGTAGQAQAGISGTDDLVFVVDILATASA
ncbi:FKBP-type peptidyl-prolyl cis-trans isomerase [Subtercola boreus]|uniref:peptidylprolyl isomerase n=1 Tax=Subtercola boreus TaxID=120213 RepID=A0A3E0WB77_9MICO|nr:FKBP-type peptidyl-prolyl cis-trans isomerase [Subtercola boreus]RFA20052.1 hypothetical protein B7R24_10785 [Subtercola boreus]RFA20182.1 hypothetical protein B7R23_10725 [Subtercola boreus]RFA26508.1 hypothetical protein B7R25_10850 [Subtercola boreus]